MQHRQAADARVEHADRPLVHLRDCREEWASATVHRAPGPRRRRRRARVRSTGLGVLERGRGADDGRRRPARLHALHAGRRCAGRRPAGRARRPRPRRESRHGRRRRGAFANAGYSVLAYDARGHGASGGEITLAGPREVADLRALRNAFAARSEVATRSAPGASPTAAARSGTRSRRRAARRGGGGRDVDVAVRRALAQNLARSGIVAGSPRRSRRARRSWPASATTPSRAEPRRPARPLRPALRRRPSGSIQDAGLSLPGQGRLRLRPHAGDHRVLAPRRPEEAVRGQLRPRAVDLPGRGRRVPCSRRASPGSTAT